jgi:hypothetical protein
VIRGSKDELERDPGGSQGVFESAWSRERRKESKPSA